MICWWIKARCTAGFQLVIEIAGQCNLVDVQWLESVEALGQLLEQLGRSPQSPLIRCLALICLSAPEERSWSRCFHPPLLVFSFPQEEKREMDTERKREWEESPGVTAFGSPLPTSPYKCTSSFIMSVPVRLTDRWLICWLGGRDQLRWPGTPMADGIYILTVALRWLNKSQSTPRLRGSLF